MSPNPSATQPPPPRRGARSPLALAGLLLGTLVALCAGPRPALGQPVFSPVVDLEAEAPEAWAMQYFASASLFTAAGPIPRAAPGSVSLGFEALYVPELDSEQRRVGFGGFKEEELNRSPVWGRLRLEVGLPAGFRASVGWVPPVEVDGVEADLISLALDRQLLARGTWGLGLRLYGQVGEVDGDLTCKEGEDHLFPPGSAENPFGCEAPSADTVTLDYKGAELVGHRRLGEGEHRPAAFLGVAWARMDLEFQVRALTFGLSDQTLLRADGDTLAFTGGVAWEIGERFSASLEGLYTALDVDRPGRDTENDPLWSLRAQLRYRLR